MERLAAAVTLTAQWGESGDVCVCGAWSRVALHCALAPLRPQLQFTSLVHDGEAQTQPAAEMEAEHCTVSDSAADRHASPLSLPPLSDPLPVALLLLAVPQQP